MNEIERDSKKTIERVALLNDCSHCSQKLFSNFDKEVQCIVMTCKEIHRKPMCV